MRRPVLVLNSLLTFDIYALYFKKITFSYWWFHCGFYLISIIEDNTKSFQKSLEISFHSFSKYSLSAEPRQGTVPGIRDAKWNPCSLGFCALEGEKRKTQLQFVIDVSAMKRDKHTNRKRMPIWWCMCVWAWRLGQQWSRSCAHGKDTGAEI